MNKKLEMKLQKDGWTVECESPLEIRNDDESFVTGRAAQELLDVYSSPLRGLKDFRPEPEPIKPTNEFSIEVTVDKIRNLGVRVLKSTEFASPQAEAFLLLYGGALQDKLNQTIKSFVTEKLV